MNAIDYSPIAVVLPRPLHAPATRTILPGAGIVATAEPPAAPGTGTPIERLLAASQAVIDYEGNQYASSNLVTFADRIHLAWSRHVTRAATVARRHGIAVADLEPVGTYHPRDGELRLLDDLDLRELALWLGHAPQREDLLSTGARHQQRRAIRHALATSPSRQRIADFARRFGHEDLLAHTYVSDPRTP